MITVLEFKKLLDQVEEVQCILMKEFFNDDPEDLSYAVIRFNNIAAALHRSYDELKSELFNDGPVHGM